MLRSVVSFCADPNKSTDIVGYLLNIKESVIALSESHWVIVLICSDLGIQIKITPPHVA